MFHNYGCWDVGLGKELKQELGCSTGLEVQLASIKLCCALNASSALKL